MNPFYMKNVSIDSEMAVISLLLLLLLLVLSTFLYSIHKTLRRERKSLPVRVNISKNDFDALTTKFHQLEDILRRKLNSLETTEQLLTEKVLTAEKRLNTNLEQTEASIHWKFLIAEQNLKTNIAESWFFNQRKARADIREIANQKFKQLKSEGKDGHEALNAIHEASRKQIEGMEKGLEERIETKLAQNQEALNAFHESTRQQIEGMEKELRETIETSLTRNQEALNAVHEGTRQQIEGMHDALNASQKNMQQRAKEEHEALVNDQKAAFTTERDELYRQVSEKFAEEHEALKAVQQASHQQITTLESSHESLIRHINDYMVTEFGRLSEALFAALNAAVAANAANDATAPMPMDLVPAGGDDNLYVDPEMQGIVGGLSGLDFDPVAAAANTNFDIDPDFNAEIDAILASAPPAADDDDNNNDNNDDDEEAAAPLPPPRTPSPPPPPPSSSSSSLSPPPPSPSPSSPAPAPAQPPAGRKILVPRGRLGRAGAAATTTTTTTTTPAATRVGLILRQIRNGSASMLSASMPDLPAPAPSAAARAPGATTGNRGRRPVGSINRANANVERRQYLQWALRFGQEEALRRMGWASPPPGAEGAGVFRTGSPSAGA